MLLGIDHLVILVRNLDDAIRTYEGLGFQVVPGGQHPGGTHNALVGFADGSYLELIAFREPEKSHDHRWYHFLRLGGGLVDFALRADDVEAEIAQIDGRGIAYRGPNPGARKRPDGQEIAWRMGWPPEGRAGELPFLIDDITSRDLRVPSDVDAHHPNGVIGIQSLTIAVRDLDEGIKEFQSLLGVAPSAIETDMTLQAQTVAFTVGAQQITLAYPSAPGSPVATRIQRLSDGPYEAAFVATGIDSPRHLSPDDAEGARFTLVPVS